MSAWEDTTKLQVIWSISVHYLPDKDGTPWSPLWEDCRLVLVMFSCCLYGSSMLALEEHPMLKQIISAKINTAGSFATSNPGECGRSRPIERTRAGHGLLQNGRTHRPHLRCLPSCLERHQVRPETCKALQNIPVHECGV